MFDKINQARQAGYSDTEILNYYINEGRFNAEAINQARSSGYRDDEVLAFYEQQAIDRQAQRDDVNQRVQSFEELGGDDILVSLGRGYDAMGLLGRTVGNYLGIVDDQALQADLDEYNLGADPRMERMQMDWEDADGLAESAGALWDNKGAIGRLLLEQLPGMLAGGGAGKVATGAGVKAAEAVTRNALSNTAKKVIAGAGVGAGATAAGGGGPNVAEGVQLAMQEGIEQGIEDPAELQRYALQRGAEMGFTRTAVESAIAALAGTVTPFRLGAGWKSDAAAQTAIQGASGTAEEYFGAKSIGQDADSLELVLGGLLEAGMAGIEVPMARAGFNQKLADAAQAGDTGAAKALNTELLNQALENPAKADSIAAQLESMLNQQAPPPKVRAATDTEERDQAMPNQLLSEEQQQAQEHFNQDIEAGRINVTEAVQESPVAQNAPADQLPDAGNMMAAMGARKNDRQEVVDELDLVERTRADIAGQSRDRAQLISIRNFLEAATDLVNGDDLGPEGNQLAIGIIENIDNQLDKNNVSDLRRLADDLKELREIVDLDEDASTLDNFISGIESTLQSSNKKPAERIDAAVSIEKEKAQKSLQLDGTGDSEPSSQQGADGSIVNQLSDEIKGDKQKARQSSRVHGPEDGEPLGQVDPSTDILNQSGQAVKSTTVDQEESPDYQGVESAAVPTDNRAEPEGQKAPTAENTETETKQEASSDDQVGVPNAAETKADQEGNTKAVESDDPTGASVRPEPAASPESAKPKSNGSLDSFGQKLGGSRKDQAELSQFFNKQYSDEEIATQGLTKIWPKGEINKIDDPFIRAFAAVARADIPRKPKNRVQLARWVTAVKSMRELVGSLMSGDIDKTTFRERMQTGSRGLAGMLHKADLLIELDPKDWDRINRIEHITDAYRYGDDGKKQKVKPYFFLGIDKRRQKFEGDNVADIVRAVQDFLKNGGVGTSSDSGRFEIRGNSTSGYFINRKGDQERRRLKQFDDVKAAREYLRDNTDELNKAWEAVKERDNVKKGDIRSKENRPRTGADHRKGKDVNPKQFQAAFGFRGVEFGDWVKQGTRNERQQMLNDTYDALMDLAGILDIPSQAISLNGDLGLGLGSRGKGLASAHFEPDMLVINLTKTRGAGSLAHEWFHALDNYFSRQRGDKPERTKDNHSTQFITYKPERMMVHKTEPRAGTFTRARLEKIHKQNPGAKLFDPANWIEDPNQPKGVRPEVEQRWASVVNALDDSPMRTRALTLDKGKDGYWSSIVERGARAFENYIITKMKKQGYDNQFLANVVPVEEFARDAGRYPYLLDSEIEAVETAFDDLFSTVQTRQTDRGVALYNRKPAGDGRGRLSEAEIQSIVKEFLSEFKGLDDVRVRIVSSAAELPGYSGEQDAGARIPAQYEVEGNTVYINRSSVESRVAVQESLRHELLVHKGLGIFSAADRQKLYKIILDSVRDNAGLAEIWKQVKKDYSPVAQRHNLSPEASQRLYAEELLAKLAEESVSTLQRRFNQFLIRLKNWLVKVGLLKKNSGKAELMELIQQLGDAFRDGRRPGPRNTASDIIIGDDTEIPLYARNGEALSKVRASRVAPGREQFPKRRQDNKNLLFQDDIVKDLPLFSRKEQEAVDSVAQALVDKDPSALQSALRRVKASQYSTMLKFVPREYLPDFQMKGMTRVDTWLKAARQMDADANQLESDAADVINRWSRWAGKEKNKAENDQLMELMHIATIAGVDPAIDYVPLTTEQETTLRIKVLQQKMRDRSGEGSGRFMKEVEQAKQLWQQEKNRSRVKDDVSELWKKLTPEAKAIYVEVRDFTLSATR